MFPTCSNRLFAGRNALSATPRTTIASSYGRLTRRGSGTSGRDLHAPPVHERANRAPLRLDLKSAAPGLPEILAFDRLPLVRGRISRHLLEPSAGAPLLIASPLRRCPGAVQALDQVVADSLELGHVRDVPLGAKQRMSGLAGLARVGRIRGQLRFEPGDLTSKLLATRTLVGCDVGNLRLRSLCALPGVRAERLRGRACRVNRACEIAWIDSVLSRILDRLSGKALQVWRSWRVIRDERPQAVTRGDQPFVLQPPVHRARRVHVHAGPARELADAW